MLVMQKISVFENSFRFFLLGQTSNGRGNVIFSYPKIIWIKNITKSLVILNLIRNILNINTSQKIEIQSVAIYDILGQIVIAVPNAKAVSSIDVSKLKTGNYFIKVKSDKGNSGMKFIKK